MIDEKQESVVPESESLRTLRDRIAAVLRERVACGHHETYEDVADAVIEALGEAGYAIVNRAESQAAVARLIEEHSR